MERKCRESWEESRPCQTGVHRTEVTEHRKVADGDMFVAEGVNGGGRHGHSSVVRRVHLRLIEHLGGWFLCGSFSVFVGKGGYAEVAEMTFGGRCSFW